MHSILRTLTALLIASTATLASAASFDCQKATASGDKILCSDARLSAMESNVAKLYARGLEVAPDPAKVAHEGQLLTKARRACTDASCVRTYLLVQQTNLHAVIDEDIIFTLKASGNLAAAERYQAFVAANH